MNKYENSLINKSGAFYFLKVKTSKEGLDFEPFPVGFSSDQDHPVGHPNDEKMNTHFNEDTVKKFEQLFLTVKDGARSIIEIGVDAYYGGKGNTVESSTSIILRNKNKDTKYVGIDIDDKTRLNNNELNIFTIKTWCKRKRGGFYLY